MNKELLAIHIEKQIIKAIGERILDQMEVNRLHLDSGDIQTYRFMFDRLSVFIFESEIAYQVEFSSVGNFLERIRHFVYKNSMFYMAESFASHDSYVSEFQLILKEALEALDALESSQLSEPIESEQVTKREPEFIDMSSTAVTDVIETISKEVRIDLDNKQIHGIVNKVWLIEYLGFKAVDLKNEYSWFRNPDFSQIEFSQMVDIALGRLLSSYIKEAA